MKNLLTDDTNNDGEINKNDGHNKHTYNLPALVTALIGAFQQHVKNGGENGGDGGDIDLSDYATIDFVDEWCSNLELADKEMDKRLDALEAGNGSNIDLSIYATIKYVEDEIARIEAGTGSSIKRIYINYANHLMFWLYDDRIIDAGVLPGADLSGYATEKYVNDAIKNIEVSGSGDCDFSKYFSYDDTAYYGANSLICNEPLVVTKLLIDGDESNGLTVSGDSRVEISNIYGVDSITFSDGSKMSTAGGNGSGGSDTITITIPSTMVNMTDENLEIGGGKYGEINLVSDGTNIYYRGAS